MECEFCKKSLSTLSNLNYHKKTNKTCQSIQTQNNKEPIVSFLTSCEFCDKVFSFQTLNVHLKTCKQKKKDEEIKRLTEKKDEEIQRLTEKKDQEIERLMEKKDQEIQMVIEKKDQEIESLMEKKDQEIKSLLEKKDQENKILSDKLIILSNRLIELETANRIIELETANKIFSKDHDEIIKMANKPTSNKINILNNSNSNINNFNYFNDPEKIKFIIDSKLTKNHIVDGQKGVAQFAYDTILKDDDGNVNYFCTDQSRGIFKFQNANGEFEKDIKAKKLTSLLIDSGIKTKSTDIANDLWTNDDGTIDGENFRIFNPNANEIIMMQSDNTVFRNELACLTSV